jgi:hypothetical protein
MEVVQGLLYSLSDLVEENNPLLSMPGLVLKASTTDRQGLA